MSSAPSFSPGDAFSIQEPGSPHPHLYFVLGVINETPSKLLAVPLNTATIYTDQTLILRKGDHRFVRHETSVSFDRTREFDVTLLQKLEGTNPALFTRDTPCDVELLQRLQKAAFLSDMIKPKFLRRLAQALNMDQKSDG